MPNPAPHTVPKGAPQPMRQVAMFVANNMVSDRRVIREAATVAAAGFAVTVHAITQRREKLPLSEQHPDGFTIIRHRLGLIPPVLPIRPRLLALLLHPLWCALAVTVAVARKVTPTTCGRRVTRDSLDFVGDTCGSRRKIRTNPACPRSLGRTPGARDAAHQSRCRAPL